MAVFREWTTVFVAAGEFVRWAAMHHSGYSLSFRLRMKMNTNLQPFLRSLMHKSQQASLPRVLVLTTVQTCRVFSVAIQGRVVIAKSGYRTWSKVQLIEGNSVTVTNWKGGVLLDIALCSQNLPVYLRRVSHCCYPCVHRHRLARFGSDCPRDSRRLHCEEVSVRSRALSWKLNSFLKINHSLVGHTYLKPRGYSVITSLMCFFLDILGSDGVNCGIQHRTNCMRARNKENFVFYFV